MCYLALDRWTREPTERFFFEAWRSVHGQMYAAERRGLDEAILRHEPTHCFEIRTWTGGGSTFFLASAFARLGRGKVITLERNRRLSQTARATYERRLPHLLPFVEFVYGASLTAFLPYLGAYESAGCCFLDGAEDAEESLSQLAFFEQYFRAGAVVCTHDWETEKMRLVRPRLEASAQWQLEVHLSPPQSVRFTIHVRA